MSSTTPKTLDVENSDGTPLTPLVQQRKIPGRILRTLKRQARRDAIKQAKKRLWTEKVAAYRAEKLKIKIITELAIEAVTGEDNAEQNNEDVKAE